MTIVSSTSSVSSMSSSASSTSKRKKKGKQLQQEGFLLSSTLDTGNTSTTTTLSKTVPGSSANFNNGDEGSNNSNNGTTSDNENLSFLMRAFPNIPQDQIIGLIQQSGSQIESVDIDAAIDLILAKQDEDSNDHYNFNDGVSSSNGNSDENWDQETQTTTTSTVATTLTSEEGDEPQIDSYQTMVAMGGDITPLDYLYSHFPNVPLDYLRIALEKCGHDVDGARKYLSKNVNSINNNGNGIQPPPQAHPSDVVHHFDNHHHSNSNSNNNHNNSSSAIQQQQQQRLSNNQLAGSNESLKTLQSLFPNIPEDQIQTAFKQHKRDLQATADYLAIESKLRGTTLSISPTQSAKEQDLAVLRDMFPSKPRDVLEAVLEAQGGLHNSIDYLSTWTAGDGDLWYSSSSNAGYTSSGKPSKIISYTNIVAPPKSHNSTTAGSGSGNPPKHVIRFNATESHLHGTTSSISPFNSVSNTDDLDDDLVLATGGQGDSVIHAASHPSSSLEGIPQLHLDAGYCRGKAREYFKLRSEAYHTAAGSFRKGNLTGRGSAQYYADLGRDLTVQMNLWNQRAAAAIQIHNRKLQAMKVGSNPDDHVADLHLLTRKEAIKAVDEAVNEWYNRWGAGCTGSGMHSSKRKPVLLPAVMKHLREKGWRLQYEEGDGWFFVLPR
ncbi:hypothetical protein HDU76_012549 [Blyttiomyces sp. JEL0837]|nr:hypothetical protein HDU76_012549 [Blyttiomyces sp. JEL0837]